MLLGRDPSAALRPRSQPTSRVGRGRYRVGSHLLSGPAAPARIGVLATAGFGFGLLLHDEVESGARVAEFLDEALNRRCPIQVRAGERDRTFVLDRALDDR